MSHDRNYEKDGIEITTESVVLRGDKGTQDQHLLCYVPVDLMEKHYRFVALAAERIKLQDELDDILVKRSKVDAARWEDPAAESEYEYLRGLEVAQSAKVEDNWKQFKPLLDELYEKRKPNDQHAEKDEPPGDVRGTPV